MIQSSVFIFPSTKEYSFRSLHKVPVTKYRTKEIGIRKVLGVSGSNVWLLLSRGFSTLVFIATLIAVPISWHIIRLWLQRYAYRIDITFRLFALPFLILMFIVLFSVDL